MPGEPRHAAREEHPFGEGSVQPETNGFPSPRDASHRSAENDTGVVATAMKQYFVYILASTRCGTLYTGVTSDLPRRSYQHRNDLMEGFTRRYGVHMLVWFEEYGDIVLAIAREKQIKGWNRAWKIRLIEKGNPNWDDLYDRIVG